MEDPRKAIMRCLQFEPPFCTAACPFALNVHEFTERLRRGSFQAAYKTFQAAVGFPVLVSQLCAAPCKRVCPGYEHGSELQLPELERAVIAYCRNRDPVDYNVPPKPWRIAIVGAGPAGLGCALRCAQKKYTVTVFDGGDEPGGHLRGLKSWPAYREDIRLQFQFEQVDWQMRQPIRDMGQLSDYDAVFLATGEGGETFGLARLERGYESTRPGCFIGTPWPGQDTVGAVALGLNAFNPMEHFLKTGRMGRQPAPAGTNIRLDPCVQLRSAPVRGSGETVYTREEAKAEAKRCLRCRCDPCLRHCDLVGMYQKFPKRLMDEADATIEPSALDGTGMIGTRSISTCNLCGLCAQVCPERVDLGEFFLQSRQRMQQLDTMPWPFHDYWLRDMAFANGEQARLFRPPPAGGPCTHLYFPGCQLGGSDPRYVSASYAALLKSRPGTGLLLQCCGAPAVWAGLEVERDAVLTQVRDAWLACGKPLMVFACPSCKKQFTRYLPEVEGVFLYDLLPDGPAAQPCGGEDACVFDPCASRDEPGLHSRVRTLAARAGLRLHPLPYEGRLARCCSWGGHVSVANPAYAARVVEARIGEDPAPYIAYCSNCRDVFAAAGKACKHLFDILFVPENGWFRPAPTPTIRRENRRALKADLLRQFWKEENTMQQPDPFPLLIPEALRQSIGNALLLEEDVRGVVAWCEKTGHKVLLGQSGRIAGHQVVGHTTIWVEYVPAEQGFALVRAYSHRMSIEEA